MFPVKCFARRLVQEGTGVLTPGNFLVRWVVGERRNELARRPAWSWLESFLGDVLRSGKG